MQEKKKKLEEVTNKDYNPNIKELALKNLCDYHDFYVQSDALFLADAFENFRSKCIEIYEIDPTHFLPAPELTWQACFKKAGVELELLTNIDMLLTVEKGIRGGMCHVIHRYVKANNKYMKNYDKNVISSHLKYLDANNLYGWGMSQKLLTDGKKLSKFYERFMKNYDESRQKGYIFKVDVEYPKNLFNFHEDLLFLPERNKIKKSNKLVSSIHEKEHYVTHI